MTNETLLNDEIMDYDFFVEDEVETKKSTSIGYKVIIADDDLQVHISTTMVLKQFEFEGKRLEFIHANNENETKQALEQHPDAAVVLLDVVMDSNDSGLKIVDYIRNTLKNEFIRIILRTGQPGEAPEDKVISQYDINDYLLKTETSSQRLFTSFYQALRSFRDLQKIENNRLALEKIINNSANLFVQDSLQMFFSGILQALSDLRIDGSSVCFTDSNCGSLAYMKQRDSCKVVAATGKYERYLGQPLEKIEVLKDLDSYLEKNTFQGKEDIIELEFGGFLIWRKTRSDDLAFIYIQNKFDEYYTELIKIYLVNYALALEHFMTNRQILKTQVEVINTLGNAIETRSHETAYHVRRVSELTYYVGYELGLPEQYCIILKTAAAMHDVGKIGIEDAILTKPSSLSYDEFEKIKTHTLIGYEIFQKSELPILQEAAILCMYHHERYDGKGYPNGLSREDIPLCARIVSAVDVFDALTHPRCYKPAWTMEEGFNYLKENSGTHFDPKVVDCLLNNRDLVVKIMEKYI